MTPQDMEQRIVRYGDLKPCRTAFIDAHTPGSDQKENFTIIGAGVTESPHQHVHIRETPGFNIGAAGQPPLPFRDPARPGQRLARSSARKDQSRSSCLPALPVSCSRLSPEVRPRVSMLRVSPASCR